MNLRDGEERALIERTRAVIDAYYQATGWMVVDYVGHAAIRDDQGDQTHRLHSLSMKQTRQF
jgi:hypothetical protein